LTPQDILDFWLTQPAEKLFTADPQFDREIESRFGETLKQARAGALDDWAAKAQGALALVIVLDQFSRNIHRGSAEMFAGDEKALGLARQAIDRGFDASLPPKMRGWFYLPFMHSENLDDQLKCIDLATAAGLADTAHWAEVHAEIIRQFKRFPHRNGLLGRMMTEEEQAFLDAGGFRG